MSHLNDIRVKEWWLRERELNDALGINQSPQEPSQLFGQYYRMYVREIPNEQCYNYIATCGYLCNHVGEILLSKEEYEAYMNYQEMIKEE